MVKLKGLPNGILVKEVGLVLQLHAACVSQLGCVVGVKKGPVGGVRGGGHGVDTTHFHHTVPYPPIIEENHVFAIFRTVCGV